jgi:hypothetical protein
MNRIHLWIWLTLGAWLVTYAPLLALGVPDLVAFAFGMAAEIAVMKWRLWPLINAWIEEGE